MWIRCVPSPPLWKLQLEFPHSFVGFGECVAGNTLTREKCVACNTISYSYITKQRVKFLLTTFNLLSNSLSFGHKTGTSRHKVRHSYGWRQSWSSWPRWCEIVFVWAYLEGRGKPALPHWKYNSSLDAYVLCIEIFIMPLVQYYLSISSFLILIFKGQGVGGKGKG
jgi:hypothetical protein